MGGGGGGGEHAPWDSRGPQLSSTCSMVFFNKNISDNVQHLVKIQIEAKINHFGTLASPIILNNTESYVIINPNSNIITYL